VDAMCVMVKILNIEEFWKRLYHICRRMGLPFSNMSMIQFFARGRFWKCKKS
jgi:hypothetical protein